MKYLLTISLLIILAPVVIINIWGLGILIKEIVKVILEDIKKT